MSKSHRSVLVLIFALLGIGWLWPEPPAVVVTNGSGPVAGARVRVQGQGCLSWTDDRGRCSLPPSPRRSGRITAWKEGYGIASIPANGNLRHLQLMPLPAVDNDDYQWLDPTPNLGKPNNCGNCHAEIHREWSLSGHAKAATNLRVRNVFAAVALDRPDDAGVCAKCHAPTLRDPALDYDLRNVTGVDVHGVHCDYCHKVVAAPSDKLGTRFGSDGLQLLRPPHGQQLFFGPLDDAVRAGERFGYSPVYKDSRYCASCHEGVIYGVHVYGTYSEWLESPARKQGKECQTCHMSPTGKMANIAPGKGGIERDPWTLASHTMPGGTQEMLRRCLSVKVLMSGARVDVEVQADNVGHRVPTGFPDHHLLLVVDMKDAAGRWMRPVQGPLLPEGAGAYASRPGKLYAKQFQDPRTGKLRPFWQAHDDPLDTRLFPGRADRLEFSCAQPVAAVRARLLYRPDWGNPLYAGPHQNDNEMVIVDQVFHPR
jgi:hypothetical protein